MKTTTMRWLVVLTVAGAAWASILSSCMNQRHLIGEGQGGAGAAGGSSGAGANEPGAGGDTIIARGTGGTSGTTGNGSTDGGADVAGLGDESSQGWALAISAQEVARRLSQFILQQPPTQALIVGIEAEAPKTNQDVGRLADALLLQSGSAAGRAAFYRWWLSMDDFLKVPRDATLFPLFTGEVRQALVDQTLAFVEEITWRSDGALPALLTDPTTYLSASTAPWYTGVAAPPPGGQVARVVLDGTAYAGLLTRPPVLVSGGVTNRAEPSRRGADVFARILCLLIPLEPSGPVAQIPAGMSVRQYVTAVTGEASCGACHGRVNDVGFAFGHFDAVGAYQATEGGMPIDTTGVLRPGNGAQTTALPFLGASDLARILAALPEVSACYATKWLAFAKGGSSADPDAVLVPEAGTLLASDTAYVVKRATINGELHLRGTIRAVTETHTFLDP